MKLEEFEKLVFEAVSALPAEFKTAMENVDIVVYAWPDKSFAKGGLLLGLYQGVPKTTWGRWLGQQIPDKISIYKGPIEYLGNGDLDKIKALVRDTVKHEIAHHFGVSDRRLRQIKKEAI